MTNQEGAHEGAGSAAAWRREAAAPDAAAGRASRLLTTTLRHRDTDAPDEALGLLAADVAEAVGARATIRPTRTDAGAGEADLTLRITVRDTLVAHLDLTRETPFDAEERELLGHAARLMSDRLTQLSHRLETRAVADITTALATATDMAVGTAALLDLILAYTGADGAMLLRDGGGTFELLGRAGAWADAELDEGRYDLARAAIRGERSLASRGEELAYRLGRERPHRYVGLFRFPTAKPLARMRLPGVVEAAETLGPHIESLWRDQVHVELLKFHGGRGHQPTEDLYERLLDTAMRLVHGADSGSLLIRHGRSERFVFQAVRGFDLEALAGVSLSIDEARGWYGVDDRGWERGRPRILRADEVDLTNLSDSASPELERRGSGTERIRSTLCLPVLHEGEVMAVLNLDNQSDPDAFAHDSRAIIDLFAAPVADLLHRQDTEWRLREAAVTDPLTGLGNRRPLTYALGHELARHRRSGAPVSVLVMDLAGFKRINDELGHESGDHALARVASTLRAHVRDVDVVARWGGDEFAAVLVEASQAEAAEVAARITDAVGRLSVYGRPLAIHVGSATAPEDGSDEEALLRRADARMYRTKRRTRGGR